jgi:hypothetical protein
LKTRLSCELVSKAVRTPTAEDLKPADDGKRKPQRLAAAELDVMDIAVAETVSALAEYPGPQIAKVPAILREQVLEQILDLFRLSLAVGERVLVVDDSLRAGG